MHDSTMAQLGREHEHHNGHETGFGGNEGWVDLNHSYASSQHQSPIYEQGGFSFMHPMQHHGLPTHETFNNTQRIGQAQPQSAHQQLLPLIMPNTPAWPSMLTNPATYSTPPVAIPQAPAATLAKVNVPKLPAIHATPTPRKTLTDSDRRRMCQYHEDNPSVKQTEIGAMFGVERSTVSKVLRNSEKYLFPDDRSLSPVKRAKGKFPDIERALSNWVRNSQKQGRPLTDAAINEKFRIFATSIGYNESHLKTNSTNWLEKMKQKNGIGIAKLTRRASETNVSDSGSLNPDSAGASASQTPNGISPTSPGNLLSPSSLSAAKGDDEMKTDQLNNYLEFGQSTGAYRHSNSQSTTSLSSAFTDNVSSSFSGGPTSPTTPFAFSPDQSGSWMPSQQARLPPPGNNFQRPRSQTFPMLGIDPSFISQNEPLTPKYGLSATAPASALDSPVQELPPPFGIDSTIASPPLHHSSSNGSMAPPAGTPVNNLQSPASTSAPGSPTLDDARRALDTLLNVLSQAPHNGLVDQSEYMTFLKLMDRMRLHQNNNSLPGGLHRIQEQDCELQAPKMEHAMSAGC